jgi:hypothetical protein
MFRELDMVRLKKALPKHGLNRGAVGTIVTILPKNGYEVEFMAPAGRPSVVVTLRSTHLKAVEN